MNKIDKLEKEGKFVQADIKRRIEGSRKKKKEINASGEIISTEILTKVKENISEILTEHNLPTAIFYIEKIAESSLQSLEKDLTKAIQEVLDTMIPNK